MASKRRSAACLARSTYWSRVMSPPRRGAVVGAAARLGVELGAAGAAGVCASAATGAIQTKKPITTARTFASPDRLWPRKGTQAPPLEQSPPAAAALEIARGAALQSYRRNRSQRARDASDPHRQFRGRPRRRLPGAVFRARRFLPGLRSRNRARQRRTARTARPRPGDREADLQLPQLRREDRAAHRADRRLHRQRQGTPDPAAIPPDAQLLYQ